MIRIFSKLFIVVTISSLSFFSLAHENTLAEKEISHIILNLEIPINTLSLKCISPEDQKYQRISLKMNGFGREYTMYTSWAQGNSLGILKDQCKVVESLIQKGKTEVEMHTVVSQRVSRDLIYSCRLINVTTKYFYLTGYKFTWELSDIVELAHFKKKPAGVGRDAFEDYQHKLDNRCLEIAKNKANFETDSHGDH